MSLIHRLLVLGLFCGGGFFCSAHAQEVVDAVVEVAFARKGAVPQREVFDRAIEKISAQYIEQLIGEAKATKNQTLIKTRILKNSGKYILFIKAQNPVVVGEELRYGVNLRVSVKNLETLLLQEGLLYKSDGPPKLLPMVMFLDRVNSTSYSWWIGGQNNAAVLLDLARQFHLGLRKELRNKGFFGLEPVQADMAAQVPASLVTDSPATEDLLLLAEYFQAQVVARGQVVIATERTRGDVYRIEVRVVALHATNGRVIGEVIRVYATEPGPFQQVVRAKLDDVLEKLASDLTGQILDAWKSGTFGASLLTVGVRGDLNYQQLSQFKKLLLEQVKDLKTLKERLFEPGRVVFEADSAATAEQLGAVIQQKAFPRFQVSVVRVNPDGVELSVGPK